MFGGAAYTCAATGQRVPASLSDLWSLHLPTRQWRPLVATSSAAGGRPAGRVMSSLAAAGRAVGMRKAVVLVGGADTTCYSKGCVYPRALDDVWVRDVSAARASERAATDLVAEMDGNDFVEVGENSRLSYKQKFPCTTRSSFVSLWRS